MRTFSDIIDLWPNPAPSTLGDDIGEEPATVRQWRNRNTLPPRVWTRVVAAAVRRDIEGVTFETLASIAARQMAA